MGIIRDKKPFILWGQLRDIGNYGEGKRKSGTTVIQPHLFKKREDNQI
jgi:hypothetical protein